MRSGLASGLLALVVRLALGGLFAFSAYMKLAGPGAPGAAYLKPAGPQAFAFSVKAFDILPDHLAVLATFAIPWTELVCAGCLIVGFWTRGAAALLSVLLVAFIAAIASVLARGMSVTCGCFGAFELVCKGPLGICNIVQNSVFLIGTVLVAVLGHGRLGVDGRLERMERPGART